MTLPLLFKQVAIVGKKGITLDLLPLAKRRALNLVLFSTGLSLVACSSTQVANNNPTIEQQAPFIDTTQTQEIALEQNENPLLKQFLIAEFNLHRGNLQAAFDSYYSLAQAENNIEAIQRATDVAVAMNNPLHIEQASQIWLQLEQTDARPYQLNYGVQINFQNLDAAQDLLAKALLNEVDISFIHEEVNRSARNVKQIETIKQSLLKLETKPDNVQIEIALARIDFLQGNFEAALAKSSALKDRLGSDKLGVESYLILAFSQNQSGQLKLAIKSLEEALDYHENTLRLLTPLLNFLLLDDQLETSKHYYKTSKLPFEEAVQLSLNYIGQLTDHNQAELALSLLEKIDYQATGLADQFYYIEANALALLDKKRDGIKLLLKTTGPLKFNAVEQAAIWLYELDDAKAINAMVLSKLDNRKNLDMILNISFLHEENERLDLADQLLSQTLDIYKNANALRYKRALLADQRGQWQETLNELNLLIEIDPQNPQYLNALGYTLLQYTKRYTEAMTLIEKAYQLNNEDPAIIDSLGWGHFLLGNNDQAVFYLNKAWNLLKDPEIGAHFGEALWQNNPEQANLIWLQALDNDQNHDTLKDTINRLNPNFIYPKVMPNSPSIYTDIAQDKTP